MSSNESLEFKKFLRQQVQIVRDSVHRDIPELVLDYEIKELIGEGGQKIVFNVVDKRCGRNVAMAFLKHDNAIQMTNFIREARITATLEHPNIIPVYDFGYDQNKCPFFSMKKIVGQNLYQLISTNVEVSLPEKLNIFLKVCDAISFAHSKGVLHRDIKPDNIQIGSYGEVLVCDWGLSQLKHELCSDQILEDEILTNVDLKSSLTQSIKGTPGYIAPELIDGKSDASVESEVYALGEILFFLLTNKSSKQGSSTTEVLNNTLQGQLHWEYLQPISFSLRACCLKALHTDPSQRYASVKDMQNDIQAYLSGFATKAENASLLIHIKLFVIRHKVIVGLTFLFLFFSIFGSLKYFYAIKEKEQTQRHLIHAMKLSDDKRLQLEQELAPSYLVKANQAFLNTELDSALALAEVAIKYDSKLNEAYLLLGKCYLSKQDFEKAASIYEQRDNRLYEFSLKYASLKTEERLSHKDLLNFLKEIQKINDEGYRDYVYKNSLMEEFKIEQDFSKIIDFMILELYYRNPNLKNLNINISKYNGRYDIDLSKNPELNNIYILEKFGAISVNNIDLSETKVINFKPLHFMKIKKFILKYNANVEVDQEFLRDVEMIDLEGSQVTFGEVNEMYTTHLYLRDTRITNSSQIPLLKNLSYLEIDKGRLSDLEKSLLLKRSNYSGSHAHLTA